MQTYCILIMFDFTKLKKIQSARPHLYGLGYPSQPSPRVTLSDLTFHLFLYKIQLTVYMRLRTRLGKARQLEGKGGGGLWECARTLRQGCSQLFFPFRPPFCSRICNLAERGLADVKFHINAP